jgi:hypothetical protein
LGLGLFGTLSMLLLLFAAFVGLMRYLPST